MGRTAFILVLIGAALVVWFVMARRNREGQQRDGFIVTRSGRLGGGRAEESWPDEAELPGTLGIPLGHPARAAAQRLEAALDGEYVKRVKQRVMSANPWMSEQEWSWVWQELKRYFLMSALCAKVPMYSARADAIWHEMLMFTREYEQFCHQFCGDMIHHAPHGEGSRPAEGERAWFDWLYGELFPFTPASVKVWGAFYRTALPKHRLQELEESHRAELLASWFHSARLERYSDLRETADYLLGRMQSQMMASHSGDTVRRPLAGGNDSFPVALPVAGILSGLLIYHSLYNNEQFEQQMDESLDEAQQQARDSDDTALLASLSSLQATDDNVHQERNSNCSTDSPTWGGSSDSHNSHDSGSGGGSDGGSSDGGGSSCSSCGSCSS